MAGLSFMELGVLAAVFAAVIATVFGVAGLMRPETAGDKFQQNRAKAKAQAEAKAKAAKAKSRMSPGDALANRSDLPPALQILEPFQRKLTQSDPNQVGETRQALIEAGFHEQQAVDIFFSTRLVLAIVLAIGGSIFLFLFPTALDSSQILIAVLGASAFGYYLPLLWLRWRISQRRKAFSIGLPDALDMILVGVQAGLSLPAALRHVVEEFGTVHPIIVEQFMMVSLEFQAGMSRSEALDRMAKRMRVPEARVFATMVSQAESLGTRMSDTLLVIAEEMRTNRELLAEQKAAELPVRMSLPLVLLVFPCLFLVIMTPVVISIMRTFSELAR